MVYSILCGVSRVCVYNICSWGVLCNHTVKTHFLYAAAFFITSEKHYFCLFFFRAFSVTSSFILVIRDYLFSFFAYMTRSPVTLIR